MKFIIVLILFGAQPEFKILKPDSVAEPPIILSGSKETLKPDLKPPYHIYLGNYRIGYRATRFTPKSACYILQLLVGVASLKLNSSKVCSVFLWKDEGGNPGERISWSKPPIMRVETEEDGIIYWNAYDFPPLFKIEGPLWAGICEYDTAYPTLVFDRGSPSLPSRIKTKDTWVDTSFDWFLGVYVNYDTIPEPEIYVKPEKLELHIEK